MKKTRDRVDVQVSTWVGEVYVYESVSVGVTLGRKSILPGLDVQGRKREWEERKERKDRITRTTGTRRSRSKKYDAHNGCLDMGKR